MPDELKGEYFILDPAAADPRRLKKEREKSRALRQTRWWKEQIRPGLCHYCGGRFPPAGLTMDHVVPLARGGETRPGNVRPACLPCNREKRLRTPVDDLLAEVEAELRSASQENE